MNNDIITVPLFEVGVPTKNRNIYSMECVKQLKEQVKDGKAFIRLWDGWMERVQTIQQDTINNIEGHITDIYLDDNICYAKVKFNRIVFGLECEAEVHEEMIEDKKVFVVDKILKAVGINIIRDKK